MLMRETGGRLVKLALRHNYTQALLSAGPPAALAHPGREHLTRGTAGRWVLCELPWAEYKHPSQ